MEWLFSMPLKLNYKFKLALCLMACVNLFGAVGAHSLEFKTSKIKLGKHILIVELAQNPVQRSKGLMNRKELEEGKGMLFIFPREETLSFWMKNTRVSLSIGFFGEDKKLQQIEKMPAESPLIRDSQLKKYTSNKPAKYALEVPIGWFERNDVKLGDVFTELKTQSSTD